MIDYLRFCETALDAKIIQKPYAVYDLAWKIMRDPLIAARVDKLTVAWNESKPFRDLSVISDPNEPEIVFDWPNFPQIVADELTRGEKFELRKRIKARRY
jgi:hypothetical protein